MRKAGNFLAAEGASSTVVVVGDGADSGVGGYQDVSSLFLVEGDKMTKTKRRFEE